MFGASSVLSSRGDGRPLSPDREGLVRRYRRNRERSDALFALIEPDAYYSRPIAQRLPIAFYEGHIPAFSFSTLVRKGLGRPSIDARLETLFARGIDPHEAEMDSTVDRPADGAGWPTRDEIRSFAAEADRQVLAALQNGDIEKPGHPLLNRAEAVFCVMEHELMHQETLLYMWHRLPYGMKRRPEGYLPRTEGTAPARAWVDVPAGEATLGVAPASEEFTWDNERPARTAPVPAFRMERHDVTNAQFLEFVEAGGYGEERWWRPEDWAWIRSEGLAHPSFWIRDEGRWEWRGMFESIDLPLGWPVYVSQAEATAFANWRGLRLPTEAEYQRAAFGSPEGGERRYPWGDEAPGARHGVFGFSSWDPEPAGSHPGGASVWGIEDLAGNGWEWTSTVFAPFPGFEPLPSYPEYSADFFDGEHYVMKGASPATATELFRPSLRNWFIARYPFVYATFRCVDYGSGGRRA